MAGTAVAALLMAIAAAVYAKPYSWSGEYLSAMGWTSLRDGTPNLASSICFNASLISCGLLCFWYFLLRLRYGSGSRVRHWAMFAMAVIGSAGLVGIGCTPENLHPYIHNACTKVIIAWFLCIVSACAARRDDLFAKRGENAVWLLFALYALFFAHLLRLRINVPPDALPHTPIGQINQKMVILAFFIYMWGQIIRLYVNTRPAPDREGA